MEACFPWCVPLAAAPAAAPSASTSVSVAIMAAFSFRGTFHVAISSSSIGEIPREKKGLRCRRYLQQISIAPTINRRPTTESTLLRVITKVLLLSIPKLPLLGADVKGVLSEDLVVGGISAFEVESVVITAVVDSGADVVEDGEDDEANGSAVAPGLIVHIPVRVYEAVGEVSDVWSETGEGVGNVRPGPGDGTVSILEVHVVDHIVDGLVRQCPASCRRSAWGP